MPPFDVLTDAQGLQALQALGNRSGTLPSFMDVPVYYYILGKIREHQVPLPPRTKDTDFAWLVASLMRHESNFYPYAVNENSGARGFFQFIQKRLDQLGVVWDFDPDYQWDIFAVHVADMLRAIQEKDPSLWENGDPWHLMQMLVYLHHAGESNVLDKHVVGPNTMKFASSVMGDVPGGVGNLDYPSWWESYLPYFKKFSYGFAGALAVAGIAWYFTKKK